VKAILAILMVLLILLPHWLNPYWVHILIYSLWFVYLCSAWNIVGGFAGQFAFAHSVFIGIGAYTSTVLYLHLNLSPWLGIFPGALFAGLGGLFMAWLSFRYDLPHLSFALITLGFAYIAMFLVSTIEAVGAEAGIHIPPRGNSWLEFQFAGKLPYYYIILAMTLGVILLSWLIQRRKMGLYFMAIRDNELGAAAVGIDLLGTKMTAMAISASLCAVAGTFWAQYTLFIEPASTFGPLVVIQMILFTAIGGIGTLWGPVVAPLILAPFGEILRAKLGAQYAGINMIVYGAILVMVILFMPHGIVRWFGERRKERPKEAFERQEF
jgi:branched-chain amino acid transport system permease protein